MSLSTSAAANIHAPGVLPPGLIHNLHQLLVAMECVHCMPVINLRQAILQLHLLDEATMAQLEAENPDLLRSRRKSWCSACCSATTNCTGPWPGWPVWSRSM
jgi:hypothetical protein